MRKKLIYSLIFTIMAGTLFTGCSKNEQPKENAVTEIIIEAEQDTSNKSKTEAPSEKPIKTEAPSQKPIETEAPSQKPIETEKPTSPPHTHNYTSKVTKEATCEIMGAKTYTCDCGDSYTEDIAKTKHIAGDWKITKKATCKETGIKVKKCTACTAEITSEVIAKEKHKVGKWITTKEVTCNAEGSKVKKCIYCDTEIEKEIIASSGKHDYYWDGNEKTRVHKCKGCNYTGVIEHNYNGIWGYFDEEKANLLFDVVNGARKYAGEYVLVDENMKETRCKHQPLVMSDDLVAYAKQRAIESILDSSIEEKN